MNEHADYCTNSDTILGDDWRPYETTPDECTYWKDPKGAIRHICQTKEYQAGVSALGVQKMRNRDDAFAALLDEAGFPDPATAPAHLQELARDYLKDGSPSLKSLFLRQAGLLRMEQKVIKPGMSITVTKDAAEAIERFLDRLGPPPPVNCPACGAQVYPFKHLP